LGMSSVQSQKIIFTKEDDIKLDKVLSLVLAQELAVASTDAVREFSSSTPETVHKTTAGSRGRQNVSKATWSRSGNQSRKKSQGGETVVSMHVLIVDSVIHRKGSTVLRTRNVITAGKRVIFLSVAELRQSRSIRGPLTTTSHRMSMQQGQVSLG
jgi:hypothetical protein